MVDAKAICDGAARSEAARIGADQRGSARIGGVTLQIVRDWVVRFNAEGPGRLIDLGQSLWDELAITISKQTLSRKLRALGYLKLSARPRHHAQDADAIPAFKG